MNTLILATNMFGGRTTVMLLIFLGLLAFSYFTILRPQRKEQQVRIKMMSQVRTGVQVEMMSGLRGKIDSVNDEDGTVVIDADGIFLTFNRMAIRRIMPTTPAQPAPKAAPAPAPTEPAAPEATAAPEPEENSAAKAAPEAPSAPEENNDK